MNLPLQGETSNPKVTLLLAPVGAGKTEQAQRRLIALKGEKPLARTWVLLPTERQITSFRARLLTQMSVSVGDNAPAHRAYFNVEFFNFYQLYKRLLAMAGKPQRCLDEAARLHLIATVIQDLHDAGELPVFGSVAHFPGFVQIVADFLYELKQQLVYPDMLEKAAATPKEVELARIYSSYQALLVNNKLVDRDGEGWVALEILRENPTLFQSLDLVIADGYDQFSPLQATLLLAICARAAQSVITLTTVPGREKTIGRRFERTQAQLIAFAEIMGIPMAVETIESRDDARHSGLRHISKTIFRPGFEPWSENIDVPDVAPAPGALAGRGVMGIEAPDVPGEVAAMLRRVKGRLLNGTRPENILIAVRDWTRYGEVIATTGRLYGLPLAMHHGQPLARNPAVVALMGVLSLSAEDFKRREVFDALRSPYFHLPGFDDEGIDLLETVAARSYVIGGRAEWMDALDAAIVASERSMTEVEDDEDHAPPPEAISIEMLKALRGALTHFFDRITPPQTASLPDFVVWLENLITPDRLNLDDGDLEDDESEAVGIGLQIPDRARSPALNGVPERDLAALDAFMNALRGMMAAHGLMKAIGLHDQSTMTWRAFLTALQTAVGGMTVRGSGQNAAGRVLVTTVAEARGLPHDHVFVVGLSEGIFPAPVAEDPLLLDSERSRLNDALAGQGDAAGVRLPLMAERGDDEGLFYELLNQASQSLTLTRPTVKEGAPWGESHLWRATAVTLQFFPIERLRAADVVAGEAAATMGEAALAAAYALTQGETCEPLHGWLAQTPSVHWGHIEAARIAEAGRASLDAHDHNSGRLRHEGLRAHIAEALGAGRVWSASQLNEMGICGYRFFANRMLRLRPLKTPENGIDVMQLGTLSHDILEATYGAVKAAELAIAPENLPFALQHFNLIANEKLDSAPERMGFRRHPLWEKEASATRRKLERLIRADFDDKSPIAAASKDSPANTASPRYVVALEMPFDRLYLNLGDDIIRVRGKIDRIDAMGERLIVLDYKTGSTAIGTKEIEKGRNFQMLVYALAAQSLLHASPLRDANANVIEGKFVHTGTRVQSGRMVLEDHKTTTIQSGLDHLERYIAQGRAGDFAAEPNRVQAGACDKHCDFHQFCRMSVTQRGKRPSKV